MVQVMPNPLKLYNDFVSDELSSKPIVRLFQWTNFGKVKFAGEIYNYDILVDSKGVVSKRDGAISQSVYGTGHKVGPEELRTLPPGTKLFILGTGQHDIARITPEGKTFLKQHKIRFLELLSPEAIKEYNSRVTGKGRKPNVTILVHVTC
jgi:hypothetical protein